MEMDKVLITLTSDETSFVKGVSVMTENEKAWSALIKIFPDAKTAELEIFRSKKGRLWVKMFAQGKKSYFLYTEDRKTKQLRLNPELTGELKKLLV